MTARELRFESPEFREVLDSIATIYLDGTARRSRHRAAMARASLRDFAPPRYYITRAGSASLPWLVERVRLGDVQPIGQRRTHRSALALAAEWVQVDRERTR